MSKGGGTQQVSSTTNTSNLPDYAQPYVMEAFGMAQGAANQGYTPYDPNTQYAGQQVAGFTPDQQTTQNNVMNLQTPTQFGSATNLGDISGYGALQSANSFNPMQFTSQNVSNPNLSYYQASGPQQFNQNAVNQYMSPYTQDVTNVQTQAALKNANLTNVQNNLAQGAQGTYGGSNSALTQAQNNQNLQMNLANINATNTQAAYNNAQSEFNTQNTLGQQAGLANLQAALGVQSLGSGQNMQAQLANQQYGMTAQQAQEAANQFQASNQLAGYQQAANSAYDLSNIGSTQNATNLSNLNAQSAVGTQQQQYNQAVQNQNYLNQQQQLNYNMNQAAQYSGILHGLPINPSSTSTQYMAAPSGLAQIGGLGLAASQLVGKTGS